MDMSLSEVFIQDWRSSEKQSAEDSARPRLFCIVDRRTRLIMGAVVSSSPPDEETIASLLPDRSDSLLESEDVQRKQ
jgi:hypothetical protein